MTILRTVAACLPLLVLLPLVPAAVAAPASDRERDLAALRDEIARLEERIAGARARERTQAERLARLELELDLQERRLAATRAERELAERRLAATERRAAGLEAELAAARRDLERRAGGLYRLGRQGPLRLAFGMEAGGEPLAALRLLRYLVRRDARAVERWAAARERLAATRERLATHRREVARREADEETARRRLAAARAAQAERLAAARLERRRLDEREAALSLRERRLAALVDALYGRAGEALAGRPIADFRGVLDWPLAGRVTQGFGPRLDPRYGTRLPFNGLEITPTGAGPAAVRAVYPGEVLYAGPLEGYGGTVVVRHPGRTFTLYAGLEPVAVAVGDQVELGRPVGAAAGALYFEIRVQNRPEDPAEWLR